MNTSVIKQVIANEKLTSFEIRYYSGATRYYTAESMPQKVRDFIAARTDKPGKIFGRKWPIFESKKSYKIIGEFTEYVIME